MILVIRQYGDPILRKQCQEVPKINEEITTLIMNMIETMDANNGVGLAANQIGSLYKLFVIRPEEQDLKGNVILGDPQVYINPVLSNPSLEEQTMLEGCLSLPGLHMELVRPLKIHVEAMDLQGRKISLDAEGFQAREIMHENDHLNGKLFIDRLSPYQKKKIKPFLQKFNAVKS